MVRKNIHSELRKSRRRMALIISTLSLLVIVILLIKEQVALLYLLSTLGVTVILFVVAFANLKDEDQMTKEIKNSHAPRG